VIARGRAAVRSETPPHPPPAPPRTCNVQALTIGSRVDGSQDVCVDWPPLPGRTNVVVPRDADLRAPGVVSDESFTDARAVALGDALGFGDDIAVIGRCRNPTRMDWLAPAWKHRSSRPARGLHVFCRNRCATWEEVRVCAIPPPWTTARTSPM